MGSFKGCGERGVSLKICPRDIRLDLTKNQTHRVADTSKQNPYRSRPWSRL